jgi:hypothetical protein|tara:strand:- start:632 stop:856 length:225 start_codon:yes stop_codon:yes gene_type:complete
MKILQNKKNGSALMYFTDPEIEILKKQKYFKIDAITLKHLANHFVKIASEIHDYLPKETKEILSNDDDHLPLKE